MEITELNIEKEYPFIQKCVEESDLISFDFEFTGVKTHNSHESSKFDSLEDKYQKMKHNCQNFCILQMGLTCLKWNKEKKCYFASIFNIYMKKPKKINGSLIMIAQVDSLTFLTKNDFDFTKTFGLGVNYERLCEREKKPINFDEKRGKKFYYLLSKENQLLLDELLKLTEEFINNDTKNCELDFLNKTLRKEFIRIFNGTEKNYSNFIYFEPNEKKGPFCMKLVKKKPANVLNDKSDKSSSRDKTRLDSHSKGLDKPFDYRFAVPNLFEIIIKKKIPIIGHYLVLDLGFLFDHFLEELPPTYKEYINKVDKYFPFIYDTKNIAESFTTSGIKTYVEGFYNDLFLNEKKLKPYHNVQVSSEGNFPKYQKQNNTKLHDAGFDSFITGCAFVAMGYKKLVEDFKDINEIEKIKRNPVKNEAMKEFLGKFYGGMDLQRDMQAEDEVIIHNIKYKGNTCVVEILDEEFKLEDLESIFTEYGDIKVHMISRKFIYIKFKLFSTIYKETSLEKLILDLTEKEKRIKVVSYLDRKPFKAQKLEPVE